MLYTSVQYQSIYYGYCHKFLYKSVVLYHAEIEAINPHEWKSHTTSSTILKKKCIQNFDWKFKSKIGI